MISTMVLDVLLDLRHDPSVESVRLQEKGRRECALVRSLQWPVGASAERLSSDREQVAGRAGTMTLSPPAEM